jgi:hypothetical protein
MSSDLLADAVDYLRQQRDLYYIHSLTLVHNGYIVADVYFYPYGPGQLHKLSSTGKVFTSAVIGLAIDHGHIAGVDQAVIDFFPDRTIANLDDWKRAMTIEHLLTMTSGLGGQLSYDDEADELGSSEDPVQYALDLPMSAEPGTVWRYSNPNAFLLSAIITGEWTDDHTFVMEVDLIGSLALLRLTFELDGDLLTLTVEDLGYWRPDPPLVFTGTAID